jgi:hypothetical protein
MHKVLILSAALAAAASAVGAQSGLRDTDRPYGRAELVALLSEHAVEFHDGGVSRYRGDGAYSFKYTDTDRPYLGTYAVGEGGEVCVTFLSGSRRCDTFVADDQRMVLIIGDGTRFPVRDRRPLVDGY